MNTPRADSATVERQEQPALQVRLKKDLAGLAPAYFGLVMGVVARMPGRGLLGTSALPIQLTNPMPNKHNTKCRHHIS